MRVQRENWKDIKNAIRTKYAWPGGYPLYLYTTDGAVLCTSCARTEWREIVRAKLDNDTRSGWHVAGAEVNWESTDLYCDHCGEPIESAYGEE